MDPSIQQQHLDKEELIKQLKGGITLQDAADELGLSLDEAIALLSHTPRRPPALRGQRRTLDEPAIVGDYRTRMRMVDILDKYNISQATLYTLLHKHDVTLRRGQPTPVTEAENNNIVELYQAGVKIFMISSAVERSISHIYKVLDRAGIPRRQS